MHYVSSEKTVNITKRRGRVNEGEENLLKNILIPGRPSFFQQAISLLFHYPACMTVMYNLSTMF